MNNTENEVPSGISPKKFGYTLRARMTEHSPLTWDCEVYHHPVARDPVVVARFLSNSLNPCRAFEPFLRYRHPYALVAIKLGFASVLDLKTGEVVAEHKSLSPLAFLVPDFGKLHSPHILRAIMLGCHPTAPTVFHVEELDLINVDAGVIRETSPWSRALEITDANTNLAQLVEPYSSQLEWDTSETGNTGCGYRVQGRHDFDPDELSPRWDQSQPIAHQYFVKKTSIEMKPGCWNYLRCQVFYRECREGPAVQVYEYVRHYSSFFNTFCPFIRKGKRYALISSDYTRTSVISLDEGRVVAEESPSPFGFCPTGFHVPDLGEKSAVNGDVAFVCGCVWGDDTSWKIQYLDLSRLEEGIIQREDRFGSIELEGGSSQLSKAVMVSVRRAKNDPQEGPWTGTGISILGRKEYTLEETELESVRRENARLRAELLKLMGSKRS